MSAPDTPPQLDLALGFAAHLRSWAEALGAPAASLARLPAVARTLALAAGAGHVCLPLAALAEEEETGGGPAALRVQLLASGVVAEPEAAARPDSAHPLVLDGADRLYLRRHFDLERHLAAALVARAAARPPAPPAAALRDRLGGLFPPRAGVEPDWQKLAVALAMRRRLTVVSGGPGTGKTTTVAALLACLLEAEPALRIALAAPTGKAAARMLEALRRRAEGLPAALRARLPAEAHTVHRLLGVTPEPGRFCHHAGNPLALDVLVVDEASMLDLALAARLVDALPVEARLVLLGDKDQLAAVEAGAVFAELSAGRLLTPATLEALAAATGTAAEAIACALGGADGQAGGMPSGVAGAGEAGAGAAVGVAAAEPAVGMVSAHSGRTVAPLGAPAIEAMSPAPAGDAGAGAPLADCVIWLSESHRFRADSGIGRLAADIRAGRGQAALGWLAAGEDEAARWLDDAGPRPGADTLARIEAGYAPYLEALRRLGPDPQTNAAAAFAAFERFRVLAAVHEGGRGLAALNAHLERHLQQALGLPPARGAGARAWLGRPLIVLRNDYLLGLYNGDIGLCLPAADGELAVFFPQAGGGFRALAPLRLPAHDTAFALTVHKSQGSEFAEVLLVLPAQAGHVLSRELLYTGVSRAAQRVTVAGAAEVFVAGCARATARWSGLADRMRGG